jgi:plasmid maintenance system antidote protein VapI
MAKPHSLLKEYRQKRQLSCAEMAKLLGVAEVTARSFENGNRRITAERAVEIERAIGIPRHQLCPQFFESAA